MILYNTNKYSSTSNVIAIEIKNEINNISILGILAMSVYVSLCMHTWRCLYKKAIDTSLPKYLNHVLIINFNGTMKPRSKSNVCP